MRLYSPLFLLFTLLFSLQALAQPSPWGWEIGNKQNLSNNIQYLHDVAYYGQDVIYAAGRYNDTTIFNGDTLATQVGNGFWLSKMKANGDVEWIREIGQRPGVFSGLIEVYTIEPDTVNQCLYIGGYIGPGGYIFGSDTITIPNSYGEMFVAKLDTGGNPLWARVSQRFANPPFPTLTVDDIKVTPDSGIIVCGTHAGTRRWLSDTLISKSSTNRRNGFVSKIDGNGNMVWNRQISTSQVGFGNYASFAKSVSVNPNGSCLVAGMFTGDSLEIGNLRLGTTNPSQNFLAFLDPNGNPVYVKPMGEPATIADPKIHQIELYGDYVYGTFMFRNSFFIPELNQTFTATSKGIGASCIIIKMKKTGVVEKAFLLPTTEVISAAELFVSADQSRIYTISGFENSTTSGGFSYIQGLNLTTFDSTGVILCNAQIDNGISYRKPSLDGNNAGSLVMGSQLIKPLNLGSISLSNHNTDLVFMISTPEGFCGQVSMTVNTQSICPSDSILQIAPPGYTSYLWTNGVQNDSAYFSTPGRHACLLTDANGRIFTTNGFEVNFKSPVLSTRVFGDSVICTPGDSLTLSTAAQWSNVVWNNGLGSGNSFVTDTAGRYFFSGTDPNHPSCTFYSDTMQVIQSEPDTLQLGGIPAHICPGDSVQPYLIISQSIDTASVNLKLNQLPMSSPDSSYWVFDTAGTYVITLSGRDHDSCLISQIYQLVVSAPIAQISRGMDSLYSNYNDGNQWYLNGSMLVGDSLEYLTINQNGTYSLVVTDSIGCTDSTSIQITDIRISEFTSAGLEVYPNPVGNELHIVLTEGFFAPGTLQINDVTGRNLRSYQVSTRSSIIDVSGLPSGVYLLSFHHYRIKLEKL